MTSDDRNEDEVTTLDLLARVEARIERLHQDWKNGCTHPVTGFIYAMFGKAEEVVEDLCTLLDRVRGDEGGDDDGDDKESASA
jgi:hypothetical protein